LVLGGGLRRRGVARDPEAFFLYLSKIGKNIRAMAQYRLIKIQKVLGCAAKK
jgi:hypothetical protein